MKDHAPRKRFGQHFLTDTALVERMVRAIAPNDEQCVVEIGPGQGALTLPLLDAIQHLHVVELDRDLIDRLQRTIASQRITIHAGDALKFNFKPLAPEGKKIRIVGNLPSNISTTLIFHLIDQIDCIDDMHFMLQKEMVDRLVAVPSTPDWGRLSIMVQYFCQCDYMFFVPPEAFSPPPRVDSAVVRLTPRSAPLFPATDFRLFGQMVNQAFTQRRKVISNALKSWLTADEIRAAGVDPGARPDAISLEGFVSMANYAATQQGKE